MSVSDSELSTTSREQMSDINEREFDVEDEELSATSKHALHADGELEYGEAYGEEPLADEAWLADYRRETEQERRQIQELTQRLRREVVLNSW